MSESRELIVLPASALPTIVAADENDILGKLAAKVRAYRSDVSTIEGRKAIASLAYEVATSKMNLIRLGKKLTEDWRQKTKAVNEECRVIEDRLDALKDQVRQPLTEFEDREKARVKAHEEALARVAVHPDMERASSEELRAAIRARQEPEARNWEEFHERALQAQRLAIQTLVLWQSAAEEREEEACERARLRAEEAERQRQAEEKARAEREARIAAEAAEQARKAAEEAAARRAREAEEAARREREAIRQRELEAIAAQKAAEERERLALVRAQEEREAAVLRERLAAEQAERERVAAIEAERKRVADQAAQQKAEADKRAANVAHQRKINRQIMEVLTRLILNEGQAKAVVTALARGDIPNVRIIY